MVTLKNAEEKRLVNFSQLKEGQIAILREAIHQRQHEGKLVQRIKCDLILLGCGYMWSNYGAKFRFEIVKNGTELIIENNE